MFYLKKAFVVRNIHTCGISIIGFVSETKQTCTNNMAVILMGELYSETGIHHCQIVSADRFFKTLMKLGYRVSKRLPYDQALFKDETSIRVELSGWLQYLKFASTSNF